MNKHRYLIGWLAGLVTFVGIAYAANVYPPLPQPRNSSAVFLVDESTGVPYVASGGGGGGGGPVTVADGADVTQGAVADAAASAGGTGTLSAKLREISAQLAAALTFNNPTGAATATNQSSQITQETTTATGVGAPADTAWSSGNGSVIAVLKATVNAIKGTLITNTTPAARTLITLDVKTVTTGGTAVTAIATGHRSAGGWIQNPSTATINLCINEIGTATGTTSSGDTTCIIPGQTYNVVPAAGAVSVISSDSSHPFSGEGLN